MGIGLTRLLTLLDQLVATEEGGDLATQAM